MTNSRSPRSTPISMVVEQARILIRWSLKSSCTWRLIILSTWAVCSAWIKSCGNWCICKSRSAKVPFSPHRSLFQSIFLLSIAHASITSSAGFGLLLWLWYGNGDHCSCNSSLRLTGSPPMMKGENPWKVISTGRNHSTWWLSLFALVSQR